jgi:hypothetical protein
MMEWACTTENMHDQQRVQPIVDRPNVDGPSGLAAGFLLTIAVFSDSSLPLFSGSLLQPKPYSAGEREGSLPPQFPEED